MCGRLATLVFQFLSFVRARNWNRRHHVVHRAGGVDAPCVTQSRPKFDQQSHTGSMSVERLLAEL